MLGSVRRSVRRLRCSRTGDSSVGRRLRCRPETPVVQPWLLPSPLPSLRLVGLDVPGFLPCLRTCRCEPIMHDVDIPTIDTTVVPTATHIQGPITRSRAKQLNYQ